MDTPSRTTIRALLAILVVACGLRLAVVVALTHGLREDRDGYLELSGEIAAGRGFVRSATGAPTAYRPPLYPLLVAGLSTVSGGWERGGPFALGAAQILLGTATVWLTWRLARRHLPGRLALLAAGLVAVDPLLVRYTALAMTETLFTALTTALLVVTTAPAPWSRRRGLAAGALFGLAALCRPTIWPWAALMGVWAVVGCWKTAGRTERLEQVRSLVMPVVAAALVVLPWVVRNVVVFGRPILTTTHGGYTLLLANNPSVWRAEVDRPWPATWEQSPPGRRQEDWYAETLDAMRRDLGPDASEPETDRWMTRRARSHIRDEPSTFLRACVVRVRRLWNVAPLGPAADAMPAALILGTTWHYAAMFAAAVVGLARVLWSRRARQVTRSDPPPDAARSDPPPERHPAPQPESTSATRRTTAWAPPLLLLVAVTLIHAVYWSNARMRAPVTPVVALLAAAAFAPGSRKGGTSDRPAR